jgi:hypothetical protein
MIIIIKIYNSLTMFDTYQGMDIVCPIYRMGQFQCLLSHLNRAGPAYALLRGNHRQLLCSGCLFQTFPARDYLGLSNNRGYRISKC